MNSSISFLRHIIKSVQVAEKYPPKVQNYMSIWMHIYFNKHKKNDLEGITKGVYFWGEDTE